MSFELRGTKQMQARLQDIQRRLPKKLGSALYLEAQIEMTEAKRRVPVDTGTLRASGFVDQPEYSGRQIRVQLSFGGAAEAYAIQVHENLHALHKIGQAKYLESVLNESHAFMLARIAARIQLNGLSF